MCWSHRVRAWRTRSARSASAKWPAGRTAQWRDLLHATRSQDRYRELASSLQRRSAACFSRLQTTSTGGLRARTRRVAGYATSNGSAGHAGATASAKLTFQPGHSMKAGKKNVELYGRVRYAVRINVTTNPTAEWIARQLTEAFPWDQAPRYLIRD